MGNITSHTSAQKNVFERELNILNTVVTGIITGDDIFKNESYNFLSEDVCSTYNVLVKDELDRHMQVDIKDLGKTLYIVPKTNDEKLGNITKKEICEKISNHYIKILYILTLIKYVYSIETGGDLSIAGIVFRNIRILDDIMEINFCDIPHKTLSSPTGDMMKIDFSMLEGFQFFVEYVLTKEEAMAFLGVAKALLARSLKQKVNNVICKYVEEKGGFSNADVRELEHIFTSRFSDKLVCSKKSSSSSQSGGFFGVDTSTIPKMKKRSAKEHMDTLSPDALSIYVHNDNPIFTKQLCLAPNKLIIKTSSTEGKSVKALYDTMLNNYKKNVSSIESILEELTIKHYDGSYSLKDIDKIALDNIVAEVKVLIKSFFLHSIIDFQNLLDQAKRVPKIEFSA